MRPLILLLLVTVSPLYGQWLHPDHRFETTLSIPISSEFELSADAITLLKQQQFKIISQEHYTTIIPDSLHSKVPKVNFDHYEIHVKQICTQCASHCPKERQRCHRNRCRYALNWLLMRKKEANEVDLAYWGKLDLLPCKIPSNLPKIQSGDIHYWQIDNPTDFKTLKDACAYRPWDLFSIDFEHHILLIKLSGGDCMANFKHRILALQEEKVMLWKEYNYWGGCRAGGIWLNWIVLPKPDKNYKIVVKEILKE